MCNEYYNLCSYQWSLKLKDKRLINGFFVMITVKNGISDLTYPNLNTKKNAFCPVDRYKEFNLNIEKFKEVPDYIIFFDNSEVESINGVMPFRH